MVAHLRVVLHVGLNCQRVDPLTLDLSGEILGFLAGLAIIDGHAADAGFRQPAHHRAADTARATGN